MILTNIVEFAAFIFKMFIKSFKLNKFVSKVFIDVILVNFNKFNCMLSSFLDTVHC